MALISKSYTMYINYDGVGNDGYNLLDELNMEESNLNYILI